MCGNIMSNHIIWPCPTSAREFGEHLGLPVTPEEVKTHLAQLDDSETKQWVVKARGGL